MEFPKPHTPQNFYAFTLADSQGRERLEPFQDRLAASEDDGLDEMRALAIYDWFARTYTPIWYDISGHYEQASVIRALPRIVSDDTVKEVTDFLVETKDSIGKPNMSHHDDLWRRVWTAAWHRAGKKAWGAAWAGVACTIGSPVRTEQWNNMWFATWAVSQNAAWSDRQFMNRATAYSHGFTTMASHMWFSSKKDSEQAGWEAIVRVADRSLAPAIDYVQGTSLDLLDKML